MPPQTMTRPAVDEREPWMRKVAAFGTPRIEYLRDVINLHGDSVVARGLRTVELRGVALSFPLGRYPSRKGMAHRLILAEGLSYLAGVHDYDLLVKAAPRADHALFTPQMAYGPRLGTQLAACVRELERDPASRRAVAYVGTPRDRCSSVTPCTESMQFLVRSGYLHMQVAMRSWDLVWGLPVDVGAFGVVGTAMAAALELAPGELVASAGSLHYYEDTVDRAVDDEPPWGTATLNPSRVDGLADFRKPSTRWKVIQARAKADLELAKRGEWGGRCVEVYRGDQD